MDEIIAYKSRSSRVIIVFVLLTIILVLLAALTAVLIYLHVSGMPEEIPIAATIFVYLVGSSTFVFGIIFIVQYYRMPKIMIYRKGDELVFLGKAFKIADIKRIDFMEAWVGNVSIGPLKIILKDGTVLHNKFVSDTYNVNRKLWALVHTYRDNRTVVSDNG